jgi:hypothetical protein
MSDASAREGNMKSPSSGGTKIPKATGVLVPAFFSLTLLVFGPGTIYLTNANEFCNSYGDLVLVGVLLAAGVSCILALLLLGLKALGGRFLEKGLSLTFAAGLLIWFQGNFLLWNYGPLDGRDIAWSKMAHYGYIDGAIWLAVLTAAFVFSRFAIRHARNACLVLLVIQLGYGAVLFSRYPGTANFKRYSIDAADEFVFSKNRNVIILLLDTFQTDFFAEIIRESPEITRSFEGFTYFRNTVGGYPYTELSVALMLTGQYYDNSQPFGRWLEESYEGNSIPHILEANGWRVDLFPKISFSVFYADDIASNFVPGIPFTERVQDIAFCFDLSLFRSLPHFLKRRVYNHQDWFVRPLLGRFWKMGPKRNDAGTRTVLPEARKKRRNRTLFSPKAFQKSQDVKFIDAMLSESSAGNDPGAFKFYHLGGPHIPLVLDENLNYVPMEVNRQNYRKAATASLKLTSLFLDRLRELGIYDESLIFIVGDHGAAYQGQSFVLQPGMPVDPTGKVVTEPFMINALPLLLAKPFAASGGLNTSDAPISSADIPATVFSALGLPVDSPGEPMFSIDPSASRERRYLTYSGRDIYSYYGDMEEHIVNGLGWMEGSWRLSGRIFKKGRTLVTKSPSNAPRP